MKSSSAILRTLSFGIPMRLSSSASSSAVVPLPIRSTFDQQLTAELDALQLPPSDESSHYAWILQALKASTTAQQITVASLVTVAKFQDSDKQIIDRYLDANTAMLDACNELTEKVETVRNYAESLRVVSRLLEANPEPRLATLARVGEALDSCKAIERRCNAMGKINRCGSLKKMFDVMSQSKQDSRLGEMLSGSMAVTSTVCAALEDALSFKSKRNQNADQLRVVKRSSSWSCSLQQTQKQVTKGNELQEITKVAKILRDQITKQKSGGIDVEELKRKCGKIEEGIKPLEESLKGLYKSMISVRMALFGVLSQM